MRANVNIARTLKVVDDLDKQGKRVPLLIMSHPGFGKTSTVRKYCELYDYNLVTVIPSQSAPDDILGIQSVKDGKLVRLTPSWFNRMIKIMENGKRTILFLDEITATDPYTMGPLLDLIFSRSLGETTLPDNVFIVAAGNYSKDLNNVFKMSAPLVNRFLVLNLWTEDYDIDEILNGTFDALETSDLESYLGLSQSKTVTYDYESFKDWIRRSREIGFGKSTYEEDNTYGLISFTSIRSLSYALKFTESYMNTFDDDLWMRIVGDTLGTSYVREGKLLREIIEANAIGFKKSATLKPKKRNPYTSIADVCNHMLTCQTPEEDDINFLIEIVKNTSGTDFSRMDLVKFRQIAERWPKNINIIHINDLFSKKLAL